MTNFHCRVKGMRISFRKNKCDIVTTPVICIKYNDNKNNNKK